MGARLTGGGTVPYDESSVIRKLVFGRWSERQTTNDDFHMRIAYLECFSGISGDMFLGALVDAGVPPRVLEDTVAALGVGARLEISQVVRSGISATKVDVWVDGEKDLLREEYWAKQEVANAASPTNAPSEHGHHHDHEHRHEHEVSREAASATHEHSHEHSHGRGLTEIRGVINN